MADISPSSYISIGNFHAARNCVHLLRFWRRRAPLLAAWKTPKEPGANLQHCYQCALAGTCLHTSFPDGSHKHALWHICNTPRLVCRKLAECNMRMPYLQILCLLHINACEPPIKYLRPTDWHHQTPKSHRHTYDSASPAICSCDLEACSSFCTTSMGLVLSECEIQ